MTVLLEFQRQGSCLRVRRSTDAKDGYQVVGTILVTTNEADHITVSERAAGAATMLFDAAWQDPDHVDQKITTGDAVVNRLVRKIVEAAKKAAGPRSEHRMKIFAAC